jgi:thiosulfate reductase cytochrome b subunit
MVTTGLLYMYFESWPDWMSFSLGFVAAIHAIGAFLLVIFLIVHVSMTTTGSTPVANIEAMITGYEDIEDDPDSGPIEGVEDEPAPIP